MKADALTTIAEFASSIEALPDRALDVARLATLDYLGVAVIGAVEPDVNPVRQYVTRNYATGNSTALGIRDKVAAPGAAYLNSTAGHVHDYDDFHDTPGAHPTVVILPALIALSESIGVGVYEIERAYVKGAEIMCALGRSLNHTHYERGWHPTATLGLFASTAACANLSAFNVADTVRALSIAASFASGLKGAFGTAMKPIQVGHAAANAVHAVQLARLGASANSSVMDGRGSFAGAFNFGVQPTWSELDDLGSVWETIEPGLVFKLYPCCGSVHAAIEASKIVYNQGVNSLDVSDVDRVDVRTHPRRLPHTDLPFPNTGLGGKFSIQYCVARALLGGRLGHADFADTAVQDSAVRAMLERVHAAPLAEADQIRPPGRADCFATSVSVRTTDNHIIESFVIGPKGFDPSVPVTPLDIERKFVDNLEILVGADSARLSMANLLAWLDKSADASMPLTELNSLVVAALLESPR